MTPDKPLVVQAARTPNIESEHIVDLVVASTSGPVSAWGDPTRAVMARSAIKPIQTLALIVSGAADAFELTDIQIALATASHSGEPAHIEAVESWLEAIGGSVDWLECGPTRPMDDEAADAIGSDYAAVHNCCSGKHSGFLSVAKYLGVDHQGYINADHPVQQEVTRAIETFAGMSLADIEPGIDGCGIPTYPTPLANLALAMARLTDPSDLDPVWHEPAARVVRAASAHPWWLSGTGRHEVLLQADATEPLFAKTGAEGVFVAGLPDRGLGIACKARDGAKRAADAAITSVLANLGALVPDASVQIVTNAAGSRVGSIEVEIPKA